MKSKNKILLIGICLLVLCAFVGTASAKTWYVDDDGGPGIDFTNIQDAINNASAGETIFVYNGTYYENINLKDGVRVQGEGADVTTIDGGGAGSVVTAIDVGPETVLGGFTITNGAAEYDGLPSGGGVYICDALVTIADSFIIGNTADWYGGGIALVWHSSVTTATIINCIITNNTAGEVGGAIYVDLSTSALITSNTIVANGAVTGGGVYSDDTFAATITNSVIWGNGDDLYNCIATYSNIDDCDRGEGNICADPMFVDAAGGDYHLQAGSSCIDAGNNTGAPSSDFDGNPRPIDGDGDGVAVVDIGAFEFVPLIFDTGDGTYPSIMGTHQGEIKPSQNINVSKLYTYPCVGTGGHTESIELYKNEELIASGTWNGYQDDWHNITLHNVSGAPYVMLYDGHEYNYTIVTGSYPQIIHEPSKDVTGGTITCTLFTDANGKTYTDWIPAIRLE